jgi:phage host-nuclease inhibitor protein Gam
MEMATLADLREKLSAPAERYAEYLDSQYSDGEVQEFTVDDMGKADWALRKLRELKQEKERNEEFAQKEKERIDEWLERENGKIDQSIQYFEGHLAAYLNRLRQDNPKLKSISLPNGRIGFRKRPAKWTYNDEVLLDGLKANGRTDLIRNKEMVDKQSLKKSVKVVDGRVVDLTTGWIVEGVTVEEAGETFRWEVSE